MGAAPPPAPTPHKVLQDYDLDHENVKYQHSPTMALPVSIGDILLLSQIAYNIGVAFTSGRKSAPQELIEVENQLFALSTALEVLSQHVTKVGGATAPGPLAPGTPRNTSGSGASVMSLSPLQPMIANCRQTLEGLQNVVKEYSKAMDPQPTPGPSSSQNFLGVSFPKRKWRRALKDNWSRVAWTTEAGNLATLRDQLTLHISCINLAVNTMHSSKTHSIEEQLQKISKILENPVPNISNPDITQNININVSVCQVVTPSPSQTQGNQVASKATGITDLPSPNPRPTELVRTPTQHVLSADNEIPYVNKPTFQVYFESNNGELRLVCPKACVYREWAASVTVTMTNKGNIKQQRVFICRCKGPPTSISSDISTGNELSLYDERHKQELDDIYFFPMSFATRITGDERKWCIFPAGCGSSGTLKKLVVQGVRPTDLDKFERKFVDKLNLNAALDTIERKKLSTFVYIITSDPNHYPVALLDFMGDDSQFKDCLKSVIFTDAAGLKRTERIYYIQLLIYKKIPLTDLQKVRRDQFQYSKTAELAIYFLQIDGIEDQRSIHIHFNSDTIVDVAPHNPKRLLIKDIEGTTSEGRDMSGDVIIRLSSVTALRNLQKTIEEMKDDLYIQTLKGPGLNEETIFQMYAGDIRITDKLVTDAEILITHDSTVEPERHRLLIRSLNGSAYFCKEIPRPADFPPILSRLLVGYAVFVEMTDRKITEFENGLIDDGGLHFVTATFEYVFHTELENLAGHFSNQDLTISGHLLEYPESLEAKSRSIQ